MRLHEHIGNNDLIGKLGMFSFVALVRMIADVKPRPAIKAAGADTADVVGRQILANFVALIRAHPQLIAAGTKCYSYSIANSPRIDFSIRTIGIELEDSRAIGFRSVVGNIRARTDGDVHLFAIRREDDVACPMSAAAEACCATGEVRTQNFGWATCFEIAIAIGKTNYAIRIRDVQKLRIGTRRIKSDSEWFV